MRLQFDARPLLTASPTLDIDELYFLIARARINIKNVYRAKGIQKNRCVIICALDKLSDAITVKTRFMSDIIGGKSCTFVASPLCGETSLAIFQFIYYIYIWSVAVIL